MKSLLLSATLLLAAPLAQAAEINVSFSEDMTEKLAEDYGEREAGKLTGYVVEDLEREFAKAGLDPARVDVVIVDAKPNHPTMKQAGDKPGLDMFRSISLGGMELSGVAYDSAGNVIGELDYEYFENDIRDVRPSVTWSDANRASNRFARRFVDAL